MRDYGKEVSREDGRNRISGNDGSTDDERKTEEENASQ